MGLRNFSRSCRLTPPNSKVVYPNPNPARFKLLLSKQIGVYTIIKVKYIDCTNFEGIKIMVHENTSKDEIKKRLTLDPHFSEVDGPIIRFKPDKHGWELAIKIVEILRKF